MKEDTARKIFTEAYPDLPIKLCVDQDPEHFVIMVSGKSQALLVDPFYAVNKSTGEVTSFSPFASNGGPLFDALYGQEKKEE